MSQPELIRNLQRFSTWLLLFLGIFTYGVYFAHYCARQSRIINRVLEEDREIPDWLVDSILVVSYGSVALFLGCLFVDDKHPVAFLSSISDLVWTILLLVWGFYARNRMNEISGAVRGAPAWFHGLWTFMFTPMYFNYKVNVLNEAAASADAAA